MQVTARGRLCPDLWENNTVRSQLPPGSCWEEELGPLLPREHYHTKGKMGIRGLLGHTGFA